MHLRIVPLLAAATVFVGAEPLRDFDNPAAKLAKYVDELPIPPRLPLHGTGPRRLTVHLKEFQSKIHRDLPAVTQFGYDGYSPGPTIEVESGQSVKISWQNDLPETHIFGLPKGADPACSSAAVRTVTHVHGAEVSERQPMDKFHNNDGWPDAWTETGETQLAHYTNPQSARTLWYHDHAMGTTGRNVAAGLYGLYEIHDDYERSLNLPSGNYDVPLLISNKTINDNGSLAYTDDITSEFWGNAAAVNGKLWPTLTVEPRKYRFRVLNASNARSYALKLVAASDRSPGPAFVQIGSDGGFLSSPVALNDPSRANAPRLTLYPAERADIIVDFSAYAGRTFILNNSLHDTADDEIAMPEIMQIKVAAQTQTVDTSTLPTSLRPVLRLVPEPSMVTRRVTLDQTADGKMLLLNGKHWNDPITERPKAGSTEVWEIANTLIATHPFHIHLVEFQVVNRQLFDVAGYLATGQLNYVEGPVVPAANEMGWKDTVRALPQMVTRIIMRFPHKLGFFVFHCHVLEHEDMDMMRPFEVVR